MSKNSENARTGIHHDLPKGFLLIIVFDAENNHNVTFKTFFPPKTEKRKLTQSYF